MNWLQKEKLDNAISFFAQEHETQTGKTLPQTFLYKYLAFLEFEILKETGNIVFDLKYSAMEYGPVPIELYSEKEKLNNEIFEFVDRGNSQYIVKSKKKPDLDYFNLDELKVMRSLIKEYAHDFATTSEISENSHKKIKSWQAAYLRKPNSIMDFSDTFETKNKKAADLSFQEENYFTRRELKEKFS